MLKQITISTITLLIAVCIQTFDKDFNPVQMLRRLHAILPHSNQWFSNDITSNNVEENEKEENLLRVGIIGASDIAKFAIIWPASKHPNVSIYSVAARDITKAKSYAKKHNIPHTHNSYDEIIHDPNIDVIYVGIITELHYSIAMKALQAQKHVFIEKPAVLTKSEALDLQSHSTANNVVLFEAYHWKYHPAARRVLEIIQSGEIGSIVNIHAISAMYDPKTYFLNTKLEGDRARVKLLDRWCYLIDEMFYYLGKNVYDDDDDIEFDHIYLNPSRFEAILKASTKNKSKNDNNDINNIITIQFEAYKDKIEPPKWSITINGTKGSITYHNVIFPFVFHSIHVTDNETSKTRVETKYDSDDHDDNAKGEEQRSRRRGKEGSTFEFQLDAFVDIVHGKVDGTGGVNQIVRNAALIERVFKFAGQNELTSW